jgi:hypothetical protein
MAADPSYNTKIQERQGGDVLAVASGGTLDIESGGILSIAGTDKTAAIAGLPATTNYAVGVASGYKIARGVHQQAAAVDTIVTGLTTVVAIVVSPAQAVTAKQAIFSGSIGNQSGAPAAGSAYIQSWKSTYDAATDFSDNLSTAWVAVGT